MTNGCLIVGGGAIGMLTARELNEAGLRVQVLDRGVAARESSWAGGGILSPLYPWRYHDAVSALARWGQDRYGALARALAEQTGIDPQWTPSGMLVLEADDRAAALDWGAHWRQRAELLEWAAVSRLQPGLAPTPGAAVWLPDVAQIRTPRLGKALRQGLLSSGVVLREHTPVSEILVQGERVRGVRTPEGDEPAETVIVAAGAWSGQLLAGVEVGVDVAPVRGQMLLFRAEPGLLERIVLCQDRYLIPRRDGRVLIGSTLEHVGFDKGLTETARAELLTMALDIMPALARYPVETQWAGLRPGKADGVPLIGEHPTIRGLYLNTGHFRNGVVLAPASARLMADLVLARPPIVDPTPYRLRPRS
jgi:glycine oxidase